MHWETKNRIWLALLQYSLYCGGLEPNPPYLQGMPGACSVPWTCLVLSPAHIYEGGGVRSMRWLWLTVVKSCLYLLLAVRPYVSHWTFTDLSWFIWKTRMKRSFTLKKKKMLPQVLINSVRMPTFWESHRPWLPGAFPQSELSIPHFSPSQILQGPALLPRCLSRIFP